MKVVKRICMVLYLIIAVIAGISFFAKDIGDDTIKEAVIYRTITSKITDVIKEAYPDVTNEQLENIYDEINKNESINIITEKYIDAVEQTIENNGTTGNVENYLEKGIVENEISKFSDEIVKVIVDGTNIELNTLQKAIVRSITTYLSQNIQSKITDVCNNIVKYMTPPMIKAVKLYMMVTSVMVKTIVAVVMCILLILIILLNKVKSRAIFDLGISNICASVLMFVVSFVAKSTSLSATDRILGRSITVDVKIFIIYAAILLIIGVALTLWWIFAFGKKQVR